MPLNTKVAGWLAGEQKVITRLPAARRVFTKANGELYKAGDLFRQPELAATLKEIASQGPAYMYSGQWARHFVDAVEREGGRITPADMADYRALWTDPIETTFRGYRVVATGPPETGGLATLGSQKVVETGDLKKYGEYTRSSDMLYDLIQISRREGMLANAPAQLRKQYFPASGGSVNVLLTSEAAAATWKYIQQHMRPPEAGEAGINHTAAVIAADARGNVACVLHSLVGFYWGGTGIFVDGISIPDSASFQQKAIAKAGPGARLPGPADLIIVLKEGKPVLASAAIGVALAQATLQNLVNILEFGMDPKTSADQPNTEGPYFGLNPNGTSRPEMDQETVAEGEFSQAVLDGVRARGQAIKVVDRNYGQRGYWIGIQIDKGAHMLAGGVTPFSTGMAEGYQPIPPYSCITIVTYASRHFDQDPGHSPALRRRGFRAAAPGRAPAAPCRTGQSRKAQRGERQGGERQGREEAARGEDVSDQAHHSDRRQRGEVHRHRRHHAAEEGRRHGDGQHLLHRLHQGRRAGHHHARPLTFAFNGGPGSSSVWLQMGALGPKRVAMDPEGNALPPPYKLVDNEYSILDLTDLVFIDPVSTGFSRAIPEQDAKNFHGINGDLESVADFIRLYTTRNSRWTSPKFLAGESYGTTRAANLSGYLQQRMGIRAERHHADLGGAEFRDHQLRPRQRSAVHAVSADLHGHGLVSQETAAGSDGQPAQGAGGEPSSSPRTSTAWR